jgi:hypothetical protein
MTRAEPPLLYTPSSGHTVHQMVRQGSGRAEHGIRITTTFLVVVESVNTDAGVVFERSEPEIRLQSE